MMSSNNTTNGRNNRMISYENLREENHRLMEENYRLREYAKEKDILISTLESQIAALVVAGRDTNSNSIGDDYSNDFSSDFDYVEDDDETEANEVTTVTKGLNGFVVKEGREEQKNHPDVIPDDNARTGRILGGPERRSSTLGRRRTRTLDRKKSTHDLTPMLLNPRKTKSCVPAPSQSPALCPPKRSTIEMKHPPAPTGTGNSSSPGHSPTSSRKRFQTGTAAIKALPRELSINKHSHHLKEDDDISSEGNKSDTRSDGSENQKPKSKKYEVVNTEFIDAYNSRGIYTGTVHRATQMPHGNGKMVYHKGGNLGGRYYDGDWHVGHWHGHGIIRDADGNVYEGRFVNNLKEGHGTLHFIDGRIFKGEFREDEAFKGTMSYVDGAQYTGELHHGNRHGYGIYHFTDGSYYEGDSIMNVFEGDGKMTWSDGFWYEGEWSRGEIHGFGKEYRADGSLRHDGKWVKGVPIRVKERRR